ncbi:hypothetical protein HY419_02020, partial [candidate division WWE3 bacterium]|nr:hypothetical protein [candidate division WWE3 bacterium]
MHRLLSAFFVSSLALIILAVSAKTAVVIKPGTKLGDYDLSYQKPARAVDLLKEKENSTLYFNLVNQSMSLSFREIGISFDFAVLASHTTKCYLKYFCFPPDKNPKPLTEVIRID